MNYSLELVSNPLIPLETKRLRVHAPDDARRLQGVYSQPEVGRYLLDEPWTPEDAARHVLERLIKTDLDGDEAALALVIEHDGT